MRIKEIIESYFSSEEESKITFSEENRRTYQSSIDNFDAVVQKFGPSGANSYFDAQINNTKDDFVKFVFGKEEEYKSMIAARDSLEAKIKNSNGLSY